MRLSRWAAVAAAASTLACGGTESALREAVESALSWSASVHMAVEAWSRHEVTAAFARTALESAQRGLEQERTQLAASPRDLAEPRVASAAAAIGEMSTLVARALAALQADDGGAVRAAADGLEAAERRLRAAGGGAGG